MLLLCWEGSQRRHQVFGGGTSNRPNNGTVQSLSLLWTVQIFLLSGQNKRPSMSFPAPGTGFEKPEREKTSGSLPGKAHIHTRKGLGRWEDSMDRWYCSSYRLASIQEVLPHPWLTMCTAMYIYTGDPHRPPQSTHNIRGSHQEHDVQWTTPLLTPEHPLRRCWVQGIPTFHQGNQSRGACASPPPCIKAWHNLLCLSSCPARSQ